MSESLEPRWTHYGWFMFCPVVVADVDSDAPILKERWPVLYPAFAFAEFAQAIVIGACSLFVDGYEPRWYFKVTGEFEGER